MEKIVRIALASFQLEVADIDSNCRNILSTIETACHKHHAQMVVFPELSLTGSSCGDLIANDSFVSSTQTALDAIRRSSVHLDTVIVVGSPIYSEGRIFDCAVVIFNGEYLGVVPKTHLLSGGCEDEYRWFSDCRKTAPADVDILGQKVRFGQPILFRCQNSNFTFGVEIGHDGLAAIPVATKLSLSGANCVINLSAIKETVFSQDEWQMRVRHTSATSNIGYLLCSGSIGESTTDFLCSNLALAAVCGKNVNLIEAEDGSSRLFLADLSLEFIRAERKAKRQFLLEELPCDSVPVVEFRYQNSWEDRPRRLEKEPFLEGRHPDVVCERILSIQKRAILKKMSYMERDKTIIGVSGGLDSTVALLALIDAYQSSGKDVKDICGLTMPGPGTTRNTYENSISLMAALGVTAVDIDINEAVNSHLSRIGQPEGLYNITYEQTQSRERTKILMDYANKEHGIMVGTGDMSELALGWMSFSGDQISMYGINAGIPKSIIVHMANWYRKRSTGALRETLEKIISTPISPELLPVDSQGNQAQKTESLIGPYVVHDFFLYYLLKYNMSLSDIRDMACQAFSDEYSAGDISKWMDVFAGRFFSRQFKRSCYPDGIQVFDVSLSPRSFWKMPSDASNRLWVKELQGGVKS